MVKSTKHDHLFCLTVAMTPQFPTKVEPKPVAPRVRRPCGFVLGIALAITLFPAGTAASHAQQGSHSLGSIGFGGSNNSPHTPPEHIVQGTVQDKEGKAIPGAIVYLKKARSAETAMVVADDKGAYRFSPLAADTDYTVWAQVGEKKGTVRPISAFSTGPLTMQLKVE